MEATLKSLIESLKPDLKVLLGAISILYLGFLFSPNDLEPIRLLTEYRLWVHLAGLLATTYLLISFLKWLFIFFKQLNTIRVLKNYLKGLSAAEKNLFKEFIFKERKTVSFSYQDGTVQHLAKLGFIYQSTTVSKRGPGMRFDYTIQPWTWDYLLKNKKLLVTDDAIVAFVGGDNFYSGAN